MDRRDARQAQAVLQDGLGVRAEDQGQLKPGQALSNRRGQVPVTEQVDPPGLAAVPDFVQGQAQSQQAPALRMPQGGDPGPGIMPAQGLQGWPRQEQVPQRSPCQMRILLTPAGGGRVSGAGRVIAFAINSFRWLVLKSPSFKGGLSKEFR